MDVREVDPSLAAAARQALLAAYRYQRTGDAPPALRLDVRRFADSEVLAAVAERAVATTLVTTEGRALTEVTMWVRNRAQPFMKVALPAGATMLSVEVGGSPAKPVEGRDGNRVPLLRPGFSPQGLYVVSFVYLHSGTPFLKKGDMEMTLPKMDVPINVVEWELFVPDRFRADRFAGDMFDARLMAAVSTGATGSGGGMGVGVGGGAGGSLRGANPPRPLAAAEPGQINGRALDETGAPLPGVTIAVEAGGQRQTVVTDEEGAYVVSNVASGPVTLTGQLAGFVAARRRVQFNQRGQQVNLTLAVGSMTETVTVTAESPRLDIMQSTVSRNDRQERKAENEAPSVNVQNLQRRASGVLPVRMEVPRAGTSHRFVKPLVIDEETRVSFRYKRR
jgi:hypothetical protein